MSITGTKGVDISYAQGNINMAAVKQAGYGWVMIRCGQGGSNRITDDQFSANVKKAETLGMPWGVYLFTEACSTAMIKDEVAKIDKLLKAEKAKGYKPTLPIALDIEEESHIINGGGWNKANVANIAEVYVNGMRALGYYPMIYTGYYELRDWISATTLNKCDVWLAEWGRYPDYTKSNLGIWQYGGETNLIESNSISGVGVIDKDLAYKDYPTIIKQGGYNGWSKPSTTTNSKQTTTNTKPTTTTKTPAKKTVPDIIYRVKTGGSWLSPITNMKSYAGIQGQPITDVAMKVTSGKVKYRVHVKGGSWLNWITKYDIKDKMTGYAGNGRPIDAIQIYYTTPSDIVKTNGYYKAKYRVSPVNKTYYSYQFDTETTNSQDGYAGDYGKTIDRLQIALSK